MWAAAARRFSLVDLEHASGHLLSVELLDSLRRLSFAGKLHKGKTAGLPCLPDKWKVDIHDLTCFGKQLGQLFLGDLVVQIADIYLGRNDVSPSLTSSADSGPACFVPPAPLPHRRVKSLCHQGDSRLHSDNIEK